VISYQLSVTSYQLSVISEPFFSEKLSFSGLSYQLFQLFQLSVISVISYFNDLGLTH